MIFVHKNSVSNEFREQEKHSHMQAAAFFQQEEGEGTDKLNVASALAVRVGNFFLIFTDLRIIIDPFVNKRQ